MSDVANCILCDELRDKLKKERLQAKAKITTLRQQLSHCADNEANIPVQAELASAYLLIDKLKSQNENFTRDLNEQSTLIAEQNIKIKTLEAASAKTTSFSGCLSEETRVQLIAKDTKIVELNNELLDKDRRIVDLLEQLKEKQQLIETKARAFTIVQKQLQGYTSRLMVTKSTETVIGTDDFGFYNMSPVLQKTEQLPAGPGHAQLSLFNVLNKSINDDDQSSITTDVNSSHLPELSEDFNEPLSNDTSLERRQKKASKKRVTFDLPPSPTQEVALLQQALAENKSNMEAKQFVRQKKAEILALTNQIDELKIRLNQTLLEHEEDRNHIDKLQEDRDQLATDNELQAKLYDARIEQLLRDMDDLKREHKNALLRAKAQHMHRIKELESDLQTSNSDIERLRESYQTMEREFFQLSEKHGQRSEFATRAHMAAEELGAENERLSEQLHNAQLTAESLLEQKKRVLSDFDTLREALDASQQFIEALESDVEVNKTHSELLREQLSERILNENLIIEQASKKLDKEKRTLLKGKAYETKLRLFEQENDRLRAESTQHRLKAKAFETKLRVINRELHDHNDEHAKILADLANKNQDIQSLKTERDQVQRDLNEQVERAEQLARQLRLAQDKVDKLEKDELQTNEERSDIETEIKSLWERDSNMKRQLTEMESTNRQLAEERQKFRGQCKELIQSENELSKQLCILQAEVDAAQNTKRQATERCDSLEASAIEHAYQLQMIKEQWDEMTSKVEKYEAQIAELTSRIEIENKEKQVLKNQLEASKMQLSQSITTQIEFQSDGDVSNADKSNFEVKLVQTDSTEILCQLDDEHQQKMLIQTKSQAQDYDLNINDNHNGENIEQVENQLEIAEMNMLFKDENRIARIEELEEELQTARLNEIELNKTLQQNQVLLQEMLMLIQKNEQAGKVTAEKLQNAERQLEHASLASATISPRHSIDIHLQDPSSNALVQQIQELQRKLSEKGLVNLSEYANSDRLFDTVHNQLTLEDAQDDAKDRDIEKLKNMVAEQHNLLERQDGELSDLKDIVEVQRRSLETLESNELQESQKNKEYDHQYGEKQSLQNALHAGSNESLKEEKEKLEWQMFELEEHIRNMETELLQSQSNTIDQSPFCQQLQAEVERLRTLVLEHETSAHHVCMGLSQSKKALQQDHAESLKEATLSSTHSLQINDDDELANEKMKHLHSIEQLKITKNELDLSYVKIESLEQKCTEYLKETECLQNIISKLNQERENLPRDIGILREAYQELDTHYQTLLMKINKNECQETEQQTDQIVVDNQNEPLPEMNANIKDLEQENECLKDMVERLQNEVLVRDNSQLAASDEVEQLTTTIEEQNVQIYNLESKLQALQTFEEEIKIVTENRNDLAKKLEDYQKKDIVTKEKFLKLKAAAKDYQYKCEQLRNEVTSLQQQLSERRSETDEVENRQQLVNSEQIEVLQTQISELENKVKEANQIIQDLQNELEYMKNLQSQTNKNTDILTHELSELQDENILQAKNIRNLETELVESQANKDNQELKNEMTEKEQQISHLSEQLATISNHYQEAYNRLQYQEMQKTQFEEQIVNLQKQVQVTEDISKQNLDLKQKLRKLVLNREKLTTKIQMLTGNANKQEAKIETACQTSEELQSDTDANSEATNTVTENKNHISSLDNEKTMLDFQLLKSETNPTSTQNTEEIYGNLIQQQKKNAEFEKLIEELQADNERILSEKSQLLKEIDEKNAQDTKCAEYSYNITKLQEKLTEVIEEKVKSEELLGGTCHELVKSNNLQDEIGLQKNKSFTEHCAELQPDPECAHKDDSNVQTHFENTMTIKEHREDLNEDKRNSEIVVDNTELSNQVARLETQLADKVKQLTKIEHQWFALQERNVELEAELKQMTAVHEESWSSWEVTSDPKLQDNSEFIAKLEIKQEFNDLITENNMLKEQLETLQKASNKWHEWSDWAEESKTCSYPDDQKAKILELDEKLKCQIEDRVQQSIEHDEEMIENKLKMEIPQLNAETTTYDQTLRENLLELERLKLENAELNRQIIDYRDNGSQKELNTQSSDSEQHKKQLEHERNEWKMEKEIYESRILDLRYDLDKLTTLREDVTNLNFELSEANGEIEYRRSQIDELNEKIEQLEQQLQLMYRTQSLTSLHSIEESNEDHDSSESGSIQTPKSPSEQVCIQLTQENELLKEQLAEMRHQIEPLQIDVASRDDQITDANNHVMQLKLQVDLLTSKLADADQLDAKEQLIEDLIKKQQNLQTYYSGLYTILRDDVKNDITELLTELYEIKQLLNKENETAIANIKKSLTQIIPLVNHVSRNMSQHQNEWDCLKPAADHFNQESRRNNIVKEKNSREQSPNDLLNASQTFVNNQISAQLPEDNEKVSFGNREQTKHELSKEKSNENDDEITSVGNLGTQENEAVSNFTKDQFQTQKEGMNYIRSVFQTKVDTKNIKMANGNDNLAQLRELSDKLDTTELERAKLATERHALCEEIMDLNALISKRQGELNAANINIEVLNDSITTLITDNDDLINRIDELRDQLEQWKELALVVKSKEEQVQKLQEECQLLRHCLAKARKDQYYMEQNFIDLEKERDLLLDKVNMNAREQTKIGLPVELHEQTTSNVHSVEMNSETFESLCLLKECLVELETSVIQIEAENKQLKEERHVADQADNQQLLDAFIELQTNTQTIEEKVEHLQIQLQAEYDSTKDNRVKEFKNQLALIENLLGVKEKVMSMDNLSVGCSGLQEVEQRQEMVRLRSVTQSLKEAVTLNMTDFDVERIIDAISLLSIDVLQSIFSQLEAVSKQLQSTNDVYDATPSESITTIKLANSQKVENEKFETEKSILSIERSSLTIPITSAGQLDGGSSQAIDISEDKSEMVDHKELFDDFDDEVYEAPLLPVADCATTTVVTIHIYDPLRKLQRSIRCNLHQLLGTQNGAYIRYATKILLAIYTCLVQLALLRCIFI